MAVYDFPLYIVQAMFGDGQGFSVLQSQEAEQRKQRGQHFPVQNS